MSLKLLIFFFFVDSGSRTYSYSSQSARGPGYSYSFSHSNGGTPLVSSYASGFHSYTPTFVPSLIDLDLDLDLDIDPDLDFYIDTDLDVDDLDLDLDFPFIGYGIGYIGRYGHWIRKPKYGFSRLYHDIDLDSLNYGGHYGYSHLDTLEPSGFSSLLSFFK